MANSKFEAVVARATENDSEVSEFTGNIRMMGSSNLSEGQTIRIPTDFKVWKNNALSDETDADPKNHRIVCYTIAESLDSDGNVVGGVVVYPSAFNKTVFAWERNGDAIRNTGKAFMPTGKPVNDFNNAMKIQDAIKNIAGKKIFVKKVTDVQTRDFNDKEKLTSQKVFEFEYKD